MKTRKDSDSVMMLWSAVDVAASVSGHSGVQSSLSASASAPRSRPTGTKQYALETQALGANLAGTVNPVTVKLAIGTSEGTAAVNGAIH